MSLHPICAAGVHVYKRAPELDTPKFHLYKCQLCGAKKRKYKPYSRPKGLKRRFRHGRWITTVKR